MFGGTATRADKPGGLDLTAQLFAAYDDDLLADQKGNAPNRPTLVSSAHGLYSGLAMTLLYERPGDRANFRSWAQSGVNYYPDLNDLTTTYHEVGLAFSRPLGKRLSIDVSPFAAYMPRYSMRLFPAQLPLDPGALPAADDAGPAAPDLDFTLIERQSLRYGGRASLSLLATSNSSVNLSYRNMRTTTVSGDESADFQVQSAGATLSHKVTRYASLRVGYSLLKGEYERSTVPITRTHNLDVGVDYRRPLSQRRRTFLRLNGGSAVADTDRAAAGRRIQAVGFATLVHQMGRTWTAQAQYRREIRYIEGFDQPIFADSATSSVGGLITRRLDIALNASYFTGTVGLSQGSPRFDSFSASARLRRALTRTLGAYVEYLFYRFEFDEEAHRPTTLPRMFNRNGLRVGLSVWLPLTD